MFAEEEIEEVFSFSNENIVVIITPSEIAAKKDREYLTMVAERLVAVHKINEGFGAYGVDAITSADLGGLLTRRQIDHEELMQYLQRGPAKDTYARSDAMTILVAGLDARNIVRTMDADRLNALIHLASNNVGCGTLRVVLLLYSNTGAHALTSAHKLLMETEFHEMHHDIKALMQGYTVPVKQVAAPKAVHAPPPIATVTATAPNTLTVPAKAEAAPAKAGVAVEEEYSYEEVEVSIDEDEENAD